MKRKHGLRSEWRRKVRDAIYEVAESLIQEGVHQFTVRQLFYQLVSRGVFESTKNNYKNFDALLVKLRAEDNWLDSLFIDTSKPKLEYYDSTYWEGQKYFVEVYCVPPDSLIYTAGGVKPISEIQKGDWVLTHQGRFRRVRRVFKRWYSGKIISIKVGGYYKPIRLTPEHKVLAIKSRSCPYKKEVTCKPICYRANDCKIRYYEKYVLEWIPASELQKGDIVVFPSLNEISHLREIKIGNKKIPLTHKLMRTFGFWISEGSIGTREVKWTFHVRELKYIGEVADTLSSLGFHVNIGRWSSPNTKVVLATGKALSEWLASNFGRNSHTKKIPSWAITLPRGLQIELLKGILYGDHHYNDNKVSFATVSQALAYQVALLLIRLGYTPSMVRMSKENNPLAKHDIFDVSVSGKQLMDFLFKFKLNLNANTKYNRFWNDGRYAYYIVKEVRAEEYSGYVYNLEVEDDESYVVEWITVHNCEKDALRAFFEPYCRRYNVNLVICRGYPSVTRLREAKEARHVPPDVKYVILYFGDFDPTGIDIHRWINEELEPYNIRVERVALTWRQVKKYNLPPMVPKKSDPRTRKFVKKYGRVAVELDALHPKILRELIRKSILKYMDVEKRMQVEVSEGITYEAYVVVDEVLRRIRDKLVEKAQDAIREEISKVLPLVQVMLMERVKRAESLDLSELYDRRAVIENLRVALRELL